MNTLFTLSKHWQGYDIFARQKLDTFKSSRTAVLELAARYKDMVLGLREKKTDKLSAEEARKAEWILFEEMMEACLWGNATGALLCPFDSLSLC